MASPSQTTTYSLVVTDANGCSSTNDATATVTVAPVPAPVLTSTACVPPSTDGLVASVPGVGGDTYEWTLTGGTISSGQGTSAITFTSGPAATLLSLRVDETSSEGCVGSATAVAQVDFTDVPPEDLFHDDVCAIGRAGITAGCGGGEYCRNAAVRRDQMAVFLLKAEHGSSYVPPACAGAFPDVPCPSLFANWVEQLATEGITAGCGSGNYCPDSAVTRAQMAAFLLKTEHGTTYSPPDCQGIFGDVACPSQFANWIEALYGEGITGGCQAAPLLYCPDNPNTRGQMAVFLRKTFGLPLD